MEVFVCNWEWYEDKCDIYDEGEIGEKIGLQKN